MRTEPAIRSAVGWLSLLATLLLASPGVRVVRADEVGSASSLPAGPTCGTESLGTAPVVVELPSEEEVARRRGEQNRAAVVTLDGRGEGYGIEPPLPPADR